MKERYDMSFRPWLWLAREMIFPASMIIAPCVAWAMRDTNVNIMDALGGAMLVGAGWVATDKLRELNDILRSILEHTEPTP